ncbi:MAG: hypothetical protein Q7S05_00375 [bacterium]|nr:hypothetical protein [bacterium]
MKRRGIFRTKFKRQDGKPVYAIRNPDGTFADMQSIGRAMRVERRTHAKKVVRPQFGFRGETKPRKRR